MKLIQTDIIYGNGIWVTVSNDAFDDYLQIKKKGRSECARNAGGMWQWLQKPRIDSTYVLVNNLKPLKNGRESHVGSGLYPLNLPQALRSHY